MSQQLGFRVVAEGVENLKALAMLAVMGCDEAQGFSIARPMEADQLPRWLAERDFARDVIAAAA